VAGTLPKPRVTATVSGKGQRRTLSYTVNRVPRQTVQFEEVAGHTHHLIGRAHGLHGRIRFTPGAGSAGRRSIVAIVSENKVPETQLTVTHYTAPKPLPPKDPSAVKVAHSAGGVVVTWKPGTEVANYRVRLTLSDGVVRFVEVPANSRLATFPGIPTTLGAVATVQAQRINGSLGATISSTATKKPKPTHKHKRHH
jgi:hypothetical protein